MKAKTLYRVFDWDNDFEAESVFYNLKDAKIEYMKQLKENPYKNLRLYKDTETPWQSGIFIEDCILSNAIEFNDLLKLIS